MRFGKATELANDAIRNYAKGSRAIDKVGIVAMKFIV